MLDQAKAAAADLIGRNKDLEDRMTTRLAAAGSAFKPSEWLLVQIGVVAGAGVVGLVLGGGNIVVGILFVGRRVLPARGRTSPSSGTSDARCSTPRCRRRSS